MLLSFESKDQIAERRQAGRAAKKPVARSRTEAFKDKANGGQLTLFESGLWPEVYAEDHPDYHKLSLEEKRFIGMEFVEWIESGKSVFDYSEDLRKVLGMQF